MSRPGFHWGPFLGFDAEATSANPEKARIVQAGCVWVRSTTEVSKDSVIIDPGVDIPAEASEVHGITTERARTEGVTPVAGLAWILAEIAAALAAGTPIVAFNAVYDLTVLDRELRRNRLDPLDPDRLRPVIDPFVIDRALDKYRKGRRTLDAMCEHYRIPRTGSHDAAADAFDTCRLTWRLGEVWPLPEPDELHDRQILWHRERQEDFAAYRRRIGESDADINTQWPIIRRPTLVREDA